MSEDSSGPVLDTRERSQLSAFLVLLAFLHVIAPNVVDALFLGLIGAALAVAKFDILGFEILGLKAGQRLVRASEEVEALPPASTVAVPDSPDADSEPDGLPDGGAGEPVGLAIPVDTGARVLWAAEQIRIELAILAGNSGHLRDRATSWAFLPADRLAVTLEKGGLLDRAVAEQIPQFMEIRNRIAHGRAVSPAVLDGADDLGRSLLIHLRETPREWVRVLDGDVPIYADHSRTLQFSRGVRVAKIGPTGELLHESVFPNDSFFEDGRFVTWEWNRDRVLDQEGWYEDPNSGESVMAWSQAMTFAGRAYPKEWGVEFRVPGFEVE